ncbi:MAG: hypothetical protein M9894_22165 [Planctomycetes bacterium]|nr:hypothetical protein [Planctomycetota bacterium]
MHHSFDGARQLSNHPTIGGGMGLVGLFFGLPFLAAGLFVMALGTLVPMDNPESAPPAGFMVVFGLVFAIPGAGLMIAGARSALRGLRSRRLLAQHADEPWLADHDWDPRVVRDRAQGVLGPFGAAGFMTLFLSIFNGLVFFGDEDVPVFAMVIVGLFDLLLLFVWGYAFYVLGRRLKYGEGQLRLGSFPFFAGQPLRVTAELPRALRDFPELKATLRYVEQVWETRGTGKNRSRTLVAYERWAEQRVLPAEEVGREVELEFQVPPGAPPTDLSASPARYWELQLDAETPGIDYHALFLVPVY